MPPKNAPPFEPWAEKDRKALEAELDKEIDSLFGPAILKAAGDEFPDAPAQQDHAPQEDVVQNRPLLEQSFNGSRSGIDSDLDAQLDSRIDSELDKLFSASGSPASSSGLLDTEAAPGPDSFSKIAEAAKGSQITFDLDASLSGMDSDLDSRIDSELDKLFSASGAAPSSSGLFDTEAAPGPDSFSKIAETAKGSDISLDLDASLSGMDSDLDSRIDSELDKLFSASGAAPSSSGLLDTEAAPGPDSSSKIAETAKGSDISLDLDASLSGMDSDLDSRIDSELDKLFSASGAAPSSSGLLDAEAAPGPDSSLKIAETAKGSEITLDLDASQISMDSDLDSQIDSELDKLFSASGAAPSSSGLFDTEAAPGPDSSLKIAETAKGSEKTLDLDASQISMDSDLDSQIDSELDKLFSASGAAPSSSGLFDTEAAPGQDSSLQMDEAAKGSEIKLNLNPSQRGMDSVLDSQIDSELDKLFSPSRPATIVAASQSKDSYPQADKSGDKPDTENLEAVQTLIDSEIDKLFVPSRPRSETSSVASTAANAFSTAPKAIDFPAQKGKPSDTLEIEIDKAAEKTSAPPMPQADSSANWPSTSASGPVYARVPELIEQFNAAYLSLDWDFTKENVEQFIYALEQIQPMAFKSRDSKLVYSILEVILKRLRKRPSAINTKLVQLIRDSQGLLAHMLLMERESGPEEKQRIKELVGLFEDLRQKAIAVSAVRPKPVASKAAPVEISPPAAPIAIKPDTVSPPAAPEESRPPLVSIPEPEETAAPVHRNLSHTDACLLLANGKWFALPDSSIIRIARSNKRKTRKILTRGYATLKDFKPLFGRISSGVFDQWAELPPQELKAYRFTPADLYLAKPGEEIGPIAVLASQEQTCRIFFCDALNFISDVEVAEASSPDRTSSEKAPLRLMIPFFDLRGFDSPPSGCATDEDEK